MIRKLSFKADPAIPYHTLEFHLRKAERNGIKEPLSSDDHRKKTILETADHLSGFLNIPAGYNIVFIHQLSLLDEAIKMAFHSQILVLGTDEILPDGRITASAAGPFLLAGKEAPDHLRDTDFLVCYKALDFSTGRKTIPPGPFPLADHTSPVFVHGDVSYSVPSGILQFNQTHSYVFQTHFGFGMPPGVSVWIARDLLFEKIMAHLQKLTEFNSYSSGTDSPRIIHASADIQKLYVLGMIISDLQNRGLQMIRNETKYKSIVLYNAFKESRRFEPMIEDIQDQSECIICGRTDASTKELEDFFSRNGVEVDLFMDTQGLTVIRLANYPVQSKEQVEYLSDLLLRF